MWYDKLTVWFSSSPLLSSSEELSPSSSFPLGTAVLRDGGPQVRTRYSFLFLVLAEDNYLHVRVPKMTSWNAKPSIYLRNKMFYSRSTTQILFHYNKWHKSYGPVRYINNINQIPLHWQQAMGQKQVYAFLEYKHLLVPMITVINSKHPFYQTCAQAQKRRQF